MDDEQTITSTAAFSEPHGTYLKEEVHSITPPLISPEDHSISPADEYSDHQAFNMQESEGDPVSLECELSSLIKFWYYH